MAGMNGFETAGYIKQHPRSRHIPIIFITAVNRDAAHVFRGYSQGAVDYLVKPFDADILRSKVGGVHRALRSGARRSSCRSGCCTSANGRRPSARARNATGDLLDVMPECIWAADADGKVNYWNRPGLAYCGLRPADVHEESFWECLHPDDRSRGARALGGRAAQRRPVRAPGAHQAGRRTAATAGTSPAPSLNAKRTGRSSAGSPPPPTSTTRSARRRRCARRSSCATISCRSRRTSCARR